MSSRESADLVIEARWVLPIAPVNSPLAHHAVAVKDGKIVAIGPSAELLQRFEPHEHIVRTQHILMPGFVNAHTQAAATLLRGLPVRGPLLPWLREVVWPVEERWLGPDFVRDGTQLAIAEMLRAGITTFGDAYLFPAEAAQVAVDARVRAVIGLPIAESANPWADDATAHLAKAERVWDEYKSNPWVCLQFAPQPPHLVSDATLQRVRRVADELDARVVMSVHATDVEVRDSLAQYGRRPLRRLDDLGLLRPGFTAVHMNRLSDEDLDIVERTGIAIIACPQSNLRLGSGVCSIEMLHARDVCMGLGTAGPASAGALDMLAEARASALLAHGMGPEEILRLATLGSASTLGLSSVIGSLEPGKWADMICIDIDSLGAQPDILPLDVVLFQCTRQDISDVWIAGRAIVTDQRLLAFDEQELLQTAHAWARRIHGAGQ